MSIELYTKALHRRTEDGTFYDSHEARRAWLHYKGRDSVSLISDCMIEAGYVAAGFPDIILLKNAPEYANNCYYAPRTREMVAEFGPGVGTFITREQAESVVCWAWEGHRYGMDVDDHGRNNMVTVLGRGDLVVGAFSHAEGIGYKEGLEPYHHFAIPPMFLGEMFPKPLERDEDALDAWAAKIEARPLRFGDRGPEILELAELLIAQGWDYRGEPSEHYNNRMRAGVHHFKWRNGWHNSSGLVFDGACARAMIR